MANILFVVPPKRFRDEELFVTREGLQKKGHTTIIASTVTGEIFGSRGGKTQSQLTLHDVKTKDYDAVVFVGGGGTTLLFENKEAHQIAKKMHSEGKVVAAICLAPVILANAGVLHGVTATVAGTKAKILEEKGATYAGPGVFTDKNIVTANGPKSSSLFADAINTVLEV